MADQIVKVISPCFHLATLAVLHHVARRFGTRFVALTLAAMLANVQMVNITAFSWAGYADTALSLYFVAAGGFLYAWYREGRVSDLAAASLAATAAAWTKNEGQFFLLGLLLLAGGRLATSEVPRRAWAFLLAPPALVLVPWVIVRYAYDIEAANFTPGASFHADLFWISARSLLAKAAQLQSFNLTFYLFLGSLVAAKLLRVGKAFWIIPGLVIWHLSGALLAYSTGRNDIEWWLGTSGDRVLTQVVPLALLAPALLFSHWIERTPVHSPAAVAAEEKSIGRAPKRAGRRRQRKSR